MAITLELIVIALSILVVVTQVMIPPFVGRPFFYLFRRKDRPADRLRAARERRTVAEDALRAADAEADAIRAELRARQVVPDALDSIIEGDASERRRRSD